MLDNVPPNPPEQKSDVPSTGTQPTKPFGPPHDDSFRKKYRDRPSKEEEVTGVEEREQYEPSEPLSPIDLSKKSPTKNKSPSNKTAPFRNGQHEGKFPLRSKEEMANETSTEPVQEEIPTGKKMPIDKNIEAKPFGKNKEFLEPLPLPELPEVPEDMFEEIPTFIEEKLFDTPDEALLKTGFKKESFEPQTKEAQTREPQTRELKKTSDQSQIREKLDHLASLPPLPPRVIKKPDQARVSSEQGEGREVVSKKEKGKGEDRTVSTEKVVVGIPSAPDSAAFQTEKPQEGQEAPRTVTIKDLAAQIIERIQVMKKGNQTSTMITLRHPAVLTGATITITQLTTGENNKSFNISFANLSPEAKLLLDRKLNEEPLSDALNRKEITVNMITTTTQPESLFNIETGQAPRDQQQQREGQQQPRQQKPKPQEEEENP